MKRLNSQQTAKVNQVIEITGLSRDKAIQYLQCCDWQIQAAINMCFSEGDQVGGPPPPARSTSGRFSASSADALFNKYKSSGSNMILAEGILRMCEDLQIEPTDPVLIVLSYYMEAATNCEFSREEFNKGLRVIKCDNVTKLKDEIPRLRASLKDPRIFDEVYKFTYKWACAKGKRFLDTNTAIGMWQLLFQSGKSWNNLNSWLEFVQQNQQGRQVVPQDTWQQLLEFINTVGDDYGKYDAENGAWPVMIDEFVEHMLDDQQKE